MAYKFHSISKKEVGTSLSEINVTPLVDVMLVLLIIFMVTAPMMKSGIGVNLPKAETESAPAEEGPILTITGENYIYFGDTLINQFLLEDRLKAYFSGMEEKIIFVKADENVPYGYVISILDIINKAGIDIVGLVTEPLKQERK